MNQPQTDRQSTQLVEACFTKITSMPTTPPSATMPTARLALENGLVFTGKAFGDTSPRVISGEICFNTSMTGYQEILTDPSYAGQIVTMTYPQIGNYGINAEDMESNSIHPRGFIIKELSRVVSNYRADHSLDTWLKNEGIVGLTGIDTRALTKTLRTAGALQGIICTDQTISNQQLIELAKGAESLVGKNLAATVSRDKACEWQENLGEWSPLHGQAAGHEKTYKIVALDCGAKSNILRNLADQGFKVTVLPFDATAEQIRAEKPDGFFISNGPGDPAAVKQTIETVKEVACDTNNPLPTFGICLGHQILSVALGAATYKLKFGHRGANHPIQNLGTGKVEITSQNHGFAVDTESMKSIGGEPTHINLNDKTLAGFRHTQLPIFAIQYHPEASPGPHDARYLFDCFRNMIDTKQSPTADAMDQSQRARLAVGTCETA